VTLANGCRGSAPGGNVALPIATYFRFVASKSAVAVASMPVGVPVDWVLIYVPHAATAAPEAAKIRRRAAAAL
jgi:hypothetical protein